MGPPCRAEDRSQGPDPENSHEKLANPYPPQGEAHPQGHLFRPSAAEQRTRTELKEDALSPALDFSGTQQP